MGFRYQKLKGWANTFLKKECSDSVANKLVNNEGFVIKEPEQPLVAASMMVAAEEKGAEENFVVNYVLKSGVVAAVKNGLEFARSFGWGKGNLETPLVTPDFSGQGEVKDEVDNSQPLVAPKMNFDKK